MKQRTLERQRELEDDKKIIESILAQLPDPETERSKKNTARENMRQQLELNKTRLLKEKILEDRLDLMIRDQAEEVWKQREQQWADERLASQKLLDECLKSQREQIVEKHEKNLEKKAVLVAEQEKLLADIEKFKNETERQREQRQGEKTSRREQIEKEIEEAKELKLMIQKEEELEDAQRENITDQFIKITKLFIYEFSKNFFKLEFYGWSQASNRRRKDEYFKVPICK